MSAIRAFLRQHAGTSTVEFALITPVLFLFIFAIIDLSRAFHAWNRAEAATQLGVRAAAVSDFVAGGLDFDGVPAAGGSGLPVPVASVNGGDPVVCDFNGGAVGCTAGWGPIDPQAFNRIVGAMRLAFPQLQPDNVVVEYQHVGLGFAGNPLGPDIVPNVTVRLTGLSLNLLTPGLIGIGEWPLPDFASTLTGEDFDD